MAQAEPEPVKLVVYDFDQTISSDHIYHKLDAKAKSRTGKGQLDELKAMSLTDVYATFGGQDRISRLDLHFKRVRTSADVAILSFGYVNVIKKTLEFVKLSDYFENMSIIGCDSAELKQVHGNKAQCIEGMKKKRNLKYNQVLFVDDDSSNIRKAKTLNACKTMEIKPRNGMTSNHMDEIERIIGVFEIEKKQEQNENNTDNENSNENSKDDKNDKNDKNSNNSSDNNNNNSSSDKNGNDNNSNSNNNNSNNDDNNNNNNNSNNDENNNGNSNTNNSNTDDSKEPATNRQSSLKQKYAIGDDKSKLLDKLLMGDNDDSETPVVDISHQSDSETNDNGDDIVLSAPVFGVPQQKE